MANAYTLYAIAVGTDVIKQISSCRIDPGIQEMLVSGDSSLDNEHASLQTQEPIVRFTTTAITAALDLLGVGGLVIDEAGESNGVDLYFRRRAMGAGIADGDSHVKLTVNLGLMYPRILNVTHGGDPASIDGELACIYDGTNYPIVIAKNQALADLSPAINEVYTIGPWWVNDVRIALVQDLTVDFGLQTQAVHGRACQIRGCRRADQSPGVWGGSPRADDARSAGHPDV
ncbi:hypothetical protein AMJ85_12030 [candidate division BRC1 bacterium SM23_51]|nr:MAG: hypothetical protein AMJ85_12030 [candidate division BRC1 bacterium SM23_51]